MYGLVRNPARAEALRKIGIIPVHGDLDDRASLQRIAGLAHTVLHFAPPQPEGSHDKRTRHLLAALSHSRLPQRLIYLSTSGVYGDCNGAWVSETQVLRPQSGRAQRRVDAEKMIRSWSARNHIHASILRVSGIYAANRLPLERLHTRMPAIDVNEDGYTNHVHADDLAYIVLAALRHGRPNRIYHASDDSPMKMGDYFDAVADIHGLPRPVRLPREQVSRKVSPAMWSFMNESRRLTNGRMRQELKVQLRYPAVTDGLRAV